MRSLTAFILAFILVLAIVPAPQAQEKSQLERGKECGTTVPPGQLEVELTRKAALAAPEVEPPTQAPYYLPLTIHIVRRSDGTGGFTLDQLAIAMSDLNRIWQPVGVQFFIYGRIDYINDDSHFNVPDDQRRRNDLRGVNVVDNTINVYFANLAGLCGQSTFTNDGTTVHGVLMDINCAGVATNSSSFAHEIAHYFDLYHTHETWPDNMGNPTKVECPSGNNCSTAGDLLCDTPADPNLENRVDADCVYNNSATTPGGCDMTAYNPPTRNLMSYSTKTCRDQFTAGQIQKVLQVLTTAGNRKNLIISGARYVDPLASASNADCSYNFPCRAVTKAIQVALHGDFIFIKPGAHQASELSGKRVTLSKWGTLGVVQITR